MRLWPRRIAPRVALVLAAALILSQAMGVVLYGWEREDASRQIFRHSIMRIGAVVRGLEDAQGPARRNLLIAANSPTLGVRLAPEPLLDSDDDEDDKDKDDGGDGEPGAEDRDRSGGWLDRQVRRRLPGLGDRPVVVAFVKEDDWFRPGRHFRDHRRDGIPDPLPSRRKIAVSVALTSGEWVVFVTPVDLVSPNWGIRVGLSLLLLVGTVAIVAVWISRRVTAPIGRFAEAADRLGVDPAAPPLGEEGSQEIATAARAFNRMQGRLRRMIDDRTRILAAISHDLRTALTRMRLRAEFIEDPEQKGKAEADLDDMQTMLDGFLAFAKDDADGEDRTAVDIASLAQSLCDDLADAGQPVTYDGPDRAVLSCRPVALRRALANLIDNAVTYGGGAEVGLSDGPATITIDVRDRGPGIPEESRDAVFDPFYRLEESRNRETGGTGLGLTLARSIARRHGGDLTLLDRPGGGLIARLSLPK